MVRPEPAFTEETEEDFIVIPKDREIIATIVIAGLWLFM